MPQRVTRPLRKPVRLKIKNPLHRSPQSRRKRTHRRPLPPPPTQSGRKTAVKAPEKTLEVQLWDAANKMRGAVPPTDYMHVCLGLVFLRYLSAAFSRKEAELKETPYAVMDDPEEYQADNVFWVPPEARWSTLQGFARSADVGKRLDDAMRAIERENEELKGVLPKIFGKADFSAQMLGGLIDHFTNLNLTGMSEDFDFLGRVYEFFLGEFSAMQGKAGGEQFTPRSMVTLMVEMIEPYRGAHLRLLPRHGRILRPVEPFRAGSLRALG
ncbi:MAG: type I restriction-modification system subunit M N-terminal domain-containing protein [Terrimicrobiaceae bacterium]